MIQRRELLARIAVAALIFIVAPLAGHAAEKPKVRAITAFVRIDRANYRQQVQQALVVLRRAKAAFEKAGYEVQTIRVTTQRFPEYTRGLTKEQAVAFFREYDQFAKSEGFSAAIGPAMLTDNDDPAQAELLAEILLNTTELNASLVVAGAAEIHWNNVRAAAKLIKTLSERSPGGIANFNFAATAAIPEYTPFFPGSYHLGPGRHFSIALQSANVVAEAFASARSFAEAGKALETALGAHARAIESVAMQVAKETGWTYEGIDLSPAPLKEVSIGAAMEKLTRTKFGSSGTMTAAAIVTAALHAIPVKRAGYSGLMVPVLEDATLAERWSDGTLTIDALLAYSAVCGTGLDTIPLPGSITTEQLERIIGDMASLAVKWSKPLSARLMPVAGKKPGDRTEFNDPFLVNARIQPLP
jgi:uncharacterized protein (UPF0210 family)